MTTTDHAIVAPAVTGDPGTRDDAGGFDPGRAFRTRDGREVKGFGRAFGGGYFGNVKLVPHCRWRPDGTCVYRDEDLDLVNVVDPAAPDPIPQPEGDAPPAAAQSAGAAADGEDDAAALLDAWRAFGPTTREGTGDMRAACKAYLARRGARPHEPADASARSARGEVAEAVLAISTQDVDPPYNEALERMRWNAEEAECVRMFLDKRDVPRADETGDFSLVGRVMRYAKAELGESYELGKRIGFVEAVQHIDLHTGGRGVATVINGKLDASALIEQICKRLSLGEDAVAAVTDAVTAEREACAQEAEQRNTAGHDAKRPWTVPHATDERACAICYSAMREAQEIAAAIRARPTPAAVLDRARPAGQGEGNGWLPIATADLRNRVLLHVPERLGEPVLIGAWWHGQGWRTRAGLLSEATQPTHWRPLPNPPSAAL